MENQSIFQPSEEILALIENFKIQYINAEWDEDGVFVYQAYNSEIADYAIANQQFGGPLWKPTRMTWIKPSFAWMLYRSGYAKKHNQTRVLKMKLSHKVFAKILSECNLTVHLKDGTAGNDKNANASKNSNASSSSISNSISSPISNSNLITSPIKTIDLPKMASSERIQWDPERDLLSRETKKNEPRKMLKTRAIQIGLGGGIREYYVENCISIEDVTELAVLVGEAHAETVEQKVTEKMKEIEHKLPNERPYWPALNAESDIRRLGMIPGVEADQLSKLGKGKTGTK